MGIQHNEYLAASRVFGCAKCKTHLSTIDGLISKVSVPLKALLGLGS